MIDTIDDCPKRLYYIGSLPTKRSPVVAVVGTRKPTSYGKEITYNLVFDLAKRGIIIISGLALGIDSIAHRAALDANGITMAILANGVDIIYPATNKSLANEILAKNGAIMSEYAPGTEARNYYFLNRNRIISGLSDAILVTEAAVHSGTMSTVSHALAQGREVFVVPGNITSPMSAGCNKLIKQGANPVTCADDIIEIIAPKLIESQSVLPLGSTPEEAKIIELLQSGIRDGDELQIKSKIGISAFSQTLTMMEITGKVRALGGNQWTLR